MSSKQPIRGDRRDRALPTSERTWGSDSRTPTVSQGGTFSSGWPLGEEQIGALPDELPAGCVVLAKDGSILYANRSFLELLGRGSSSVAGARIQDLLQPGSAIFYETQFTPSLLIRRELLEISLDFVTASGERVPTLVNAKLGEEESGTQGQILLSIFGAKQRRLYETELLRARREAEVVSEVVRRSSDAILRISASDEIESWNRGAEQIFGYPARDAIGRSIFLLISEECHQHFRDSIEKIKSGEEIVTETVGRCDSGQPVDVSISLSPHLEAPGVFVGYAAIFRNATERKLAEKALLQSEKLASVGRLASSIAHEINNPLEAVTNLLYLLSLKDADDMTKALIRSAQEELARVSHITTHTLRFHRQSSSRTKINMRGLFDSVIGLYRARLHNSGITAINDCDAHLSFVSFEGEIRQILVNLVANAFDSMRSGGSLVLRSRRAAVHGDGRSEIRIAVVDTGSGMAAEVKQRLFEPFFTTKGIGGTGLGLWITKDLVRKNQGSIKIRSSTRPALSGTFVSLRFPEEPD